MIIKALTSAVDIAAAADTVSDSNLVSVVNINAAATQIVVGPGIVWIGAGERVVIEKGNSETVDAPDVASGVWATGVAFRA